jgi:uncharacterized membrane protein (DUF106 family)
MKRFFEFVLTLIIFYGVFEAFDSAAPVVVDNPHPFWVVVAALLASFILLWLYVLTVRHTMKRTYKEKIAALKEQLEDQKKQGRNREQINDEVSRIKKEADVSVTTNYEE